MDSFIWVGLPCTGLAALLLARRRQSVRRRPRLQQFSLVRSAAFAFRKTSRGRQADHSRSG
jgi:hypothetical protein